MSRVRLSGFCPECGSSMRYWVDPMVPILEARNEDPSCHGCDEDHWICTPCRLEFPLLFEVAA